MGRDHSFCRVLLNETMKDVRRFYTAEQIKKAWAYLYENDFAEFHGPNDFFASFNADCLWEAKANGWSKLLEKEHGEQLNAEIAAAEQKAKEASRRLPWREP